MMGGGPSHVDLFDPKPEMHKHNGKPMPDSLMKTTRLATTQGQKAVQGPRRPAPVQTLGQERHGDRGHHPVHRLNRGRDLRRPVGQHRGGQPRPGGDVFPHRPASCPAGLHSVRGLVTGWALMNEDLPSFVVMTSRDRENSCGQLLYDHYWGSGFLPSEYQGVQPTRGQGDPVLYIKDPKRHQTASSAAKRSTTSTSSITSDTKRLATRRSRPASRSTSSPTECRCPCPELTDLSNESEDTLDAVRPGCASARVVRAQLPACAPARGARRPVHPAHARGLGPAQQPADPVQGPVQRYRPALGRPGARPQTPRPARRHAGHLGR